MIRHCQDSHKPGSCSSISSKHYSSIKFHSHDSGLKINNCRTYELLQCIAWLINGKLTISDWAKMRAIFQLQTWIQATYSSHVLSTHPVWEHTSMHCLRHLWSGETENWQSVHKNFWRRRSTRAMVSRTHSDLSTRPIWQYWIQPNRTKKTGQIQNIKIIYIEKFL